MEPIVQLSTQTGVIWDWRVATDLFLGGVGVGAFLFSFMLSGFADKKYLPLARTGAAIAPAAVVIGLALLFWKLGFRENAMQIGFNIASTSIMWWGAYLQGLFVVLATILAFRGLSSGTAPLGWVTALLAIAVGIYHGLLFSVVASHPVWASSSMVIGSALLFVMTGIAATLVVHVLRSRATAEGDFESYISGLKPIGYVLLGTILLMLVNLLAWWADLRFGSSQSQEALAQALSQYGALIGVVGIGLGLIVPLILGVWVIRGTGAIDPEGSRKRASTAAIACVLLLIGGFAIRYSVILGGQVEPSIATMAILS